MNRSWQDAAVDVAAIVGVVVLAALQVIDPTVVIGVIGTIVGAMAGARGARAVSEKSGGNSTPPPPMGGVHLIVLALLSVFSLKGLRT